jgi:SAM-dependent methyltransferase
MLATGLGEDKILPHLKGIKRGKIDIACVNSPESTTISGDEDAIDELAEFLDGLGVFNRKLKVDTAYHSHHMKTVADSYELSLQSIESSSTHDGIVFFSSVTGIAKSTDFGPSYWTQNLVSPVQFQQALQAVAEDMANSGPQTANLFVEIGPHSSLAGPSRQVISAALGESFRYTYVSALVRNKHAIQTTLESIGKLYELGCMMNLAGVSAFPALSARQSVIPDLPPYSWDHTSTYWHESRLSRDHRLRRFPYHDLIGVLDVIGDVQSPRWRHHIDPESMPWLRDHAVDGFILFPGTGYISMAIEALHQLIQLRGTLGTVSRFNLRDVKFIKSLIVPEPSTDDERQQVEVQITLTSETGSSDSKGRWEVFRVTSYDRANATWIEHCTGLISAHMARAADDFEVDVDKDHAINLLSKIQAASTISLDVTKFYNDLATSGNVFGPTFRGLQELHLGDHEAYAKLSVPDIASSMPASYMQPHIMHPATMDALNHLAAALYQKHNGNSPFVAAAIDELSISTSITSNAGAELIVASRMAAQGFRGATGNTWVFQDPRGNAQPVLTITGWRLQAIGEVVSAESGLPFERSMTYEMDWKVDVDHLSNEAFNKRLADANLYGIGYPPGFSVSDAMYFRESAALIYIKKAVQRMKGNAKKIDTAAPHLPKLYEWMEQLIIEENRSMMPVIPGFSGHVPDDGAEEFILQQASKTGAQGAMLERIGSKLEEILTGDVESLSLMFEDDLLERLYGEDMMRSNYAQMAEYIKLLSFKHPQMNILEIGAGTGGATLPLLQALDDPVDGLVFSRYCYTDISSGFFERARVKFSHWEHRMDFKTLDVSKDPLQQPGFADAKFDLIVAANVLHATPSLDTTVANCHKLLKPGGRMMLMEVTRLTLTLNTIFGTLPGWWMSEDGRKNTPTVSVPQWNSVLQCQGFDGVEIAAPDHQGDTAIMTAMVCKRAEQRLEANGVTPHAVTVLLGHRDSRSTLLADCMSESLRQLSINCHVEDLVKAQIHENGSFILLDTTERPILKDPSPEEFAKIQQLITSSKNVLWTSLHCSDSATSIAAKGMANGLARVARHENTFINLVTLEVRDPVAGHRVQDIAQNAVNVALLSFWPPKGTTASEEKEYAIQAAQVLIPRVRVDAKFNTWVASTRAENKITATTPYRNGSRPIKLEPEVPGLLNTLRFIDDEIPTTPIAPYEIQVRPYAYGVNFKDVFVALGQAPPGAIMAGELSGVVTAVGTEMAGLYSVGDRVAGMGAEPYASDPRLHGLCAHKIPESVGFVEGASAVAVFCTAWHCLVTVANLRKGESVLIRYV